MTLMARLCAMCAVNALVQLALPDSKAKGSLRVIGGLLMLHVTLTGAQEVLELLTNEKELISVFEKMLE